MSGFILSGKLMEKKTIKTKNNKQLDVVVIWAKNGLSGRAFEVIDWEGKVNGHDLNSDIAVPVSVNTSASKSGRAYLNLGVQGSPVNLPARMAE